MDKLRVYWISCSALAVFAMLGLGVFKSQSASNTQPIGPDQTLPADDPDTRLLSLAFSSQGDKIAVGGWGGTVSYYALSHQKSHSFQDEDGGDVRAITFAQSGKQIVYASGSVIFRSTETGKVVRTIHGDGSWITSMALSDNAQLVASSSAKGTSARRVSDSRLLWSTKESSSIVKFRPKSTLLAVAHGNTIALLDVNRKRTLWQQHVSKGSIYSLSFTPDGKEFVIGTSDGMIERRSATEGSLIRVWKGADGAIMSLCVSPVDTYVAGADAMSFRLWNYQNGKLYMTSSKLKESFPITDMTFSPDGKDLALVVGSSVKIWTLHLTK